jgi:hypothetical protein
MFYGTHGHEYKFVLDLLCVLCDKEMENGRDMRSSVFRETGGTHLCWTRDRNPDPECATFHRKANYLSNLSKRNFKKSTNIFSLLVYQWGIWK